jgi:glyoxylase-like metal-dependent hydrolase (beta-lactamase superfamily II)
MIKLRFLEAGSCTHQERMVLRSGRRTPLRFASMVAVLEHKQRGIALFDTGYSPRFHVETRSWPERLYALVTPVDISPEETAARRLQQQGISPRDVRTIILSHFHADHIGGAADFPSASFVYQHSAWAAVRDLGRIRATRAGFLRGLLPPDFEVRSNPIPAPALAHGVCPLPFRGHDIFGDGSAILIDLPGHARGHSGLYVHADDGEYFLVGDACWLSRAFRENQMPHIVTALIMDDRGKYRSTLAALHDLCARRPDLRIVPCHCSEAYAAIPHYAEPAPA